MWHGRQRRALFANPLSWHKKAFTISLALRYITMKLSIAASLVAAVSAFAPQPRNAVKTSLANDLFDGDDKPAKKEMSKALPFVPRPKLLDGTLAGDVGFE